MNSELSYTSSVVVTDANTAQTLGSGDLQVFATPAMVALMENAAMNAAATLLGEGETTVGAQISVSHTKPTGIGHTVTATATLTAHEGRKLSFTVVASDEDGTIGEGTHTRYVVSRERFMAKVQ